MGVPLVTSHDGWITCSSLIASKPWNPTDTPSDLTSPMQDHLSVGAIIGTAVAYGPIYIQPRQVLLEMPQISDVLRPLWTHRQRYHLTLPTPGQRSFVEPPVKANVCEYQHA
jgi:hypothetical protein